MPRCAAAQRGTVVTGAGGRGGYFTTRVRERPIVRATATMITAP
ncbi:hypothetical protein SAMN05428996_2112 [Quadrisphaera sp. DSM 44207]|nr:hypothetical protein SAMN05428996_2112 [Quadrisphaera sp. DSM 44207]